MTIQPPQTRRQFIIGSAGAGAAAIFGAAAAASHTRRSASARTRPNPSDRVTLAVIGCGGMGAANAHSFLNLPGAQLVAVCDPDRNHRQELKRQIEDFYARATPTGQYRGCDEYNDFRDVLARGDIDAVIQATPDHWHADITIEAAKAGKDIYGEKPLSLTIDEGRAMSDAIARYGRIFQTGSQQRSDSRFRHACELVRNGRIGTVRHVTCGLPTGPSTGNHPEIPVPEGFDYDLWLGPAPWAPYCENRTHFQFRWISDYSGGQITDWGAHHIDIAHWGLGLTRTGPREVEGVGEFPNDGLWDTATNYRFTCKYENGLAITVTNDFENGVKWEGDDGWIFVNRGRIDAEPKSLLSEVIGPYEVKLRESPGHHRDFLDCVRTRRDPIAPIEEAHRTITVAHLGNIAMRLGRRVRWDPAAESFIDDTTAERMRSRAPREAWRF